MELKDIIHNGREVKEIERIFREIFEDEYDQMMEYIFSMHQKYTREERKNFSYCRMIDSFLYD